ncbi:Putative Ca2+/H+ antiporter, TMEM165/GDT1 family [Actinopolyspora xinjiangensis]|uniref:GDT1 family protein n=1 Tax=Actinopolyspora xinjiangensis TaxID=405564 RepID=A0A1H0UEU8_9ACTN|nr:TMEM165/GDT1 family protein [Actinopolyspora xinjiangensis]SDP64704.1 Putative Ca2+/H+ antiporter, TMEM165/GDT1 family [Actinopolyspora xinjiangensis]
MLVSFALSSVAVFLAELGDKSQLLAMTFATRYRAWQVLVGISVATLFVHAISVALGFGIGNALPTQWVALGAGVAFLGFAVWTLRGDELDESRHDTASRRGVRAALLAVTTAFVLAEFGDKTMLATVTLATRHDWFGTWLGSTVGMVVADGLAVGVGLLLARHLSSRTVRYGAAALFAVFGGWMIVSSLPPIG